MASSNSFLITITFKKTIASKSEVSILQQHISAVFTLWNSKKYIAICLRDSKKFYFCDFIIWLHEWQTNPTYFAKAALTPCFNYGFLFSDPSYMR